MYGTGIALLMVVRSGHAGGVKGAEASLTDETLATMSPFALVRRVSVGGAAGIRTPGLLIAKAFPTPSVTGLCVA